MLLYFNKMKSEEIITVKDIYDYNGKLFFIMEYLQHGSLRDLIKKRHSKYSEDFCRYTLYKVALGL